MRWSSELLFERSLLSEMLLWLVLLLLMFLLLLLVTQPQADLC